MLDKPRFTGCSPRAICCEHLPCYHSRKLFAHAAEKVDWAEKVFSVSPACNSVSCRPLTIQFARWPFITNKTHTTRRLSTEVPICSFTWQIGQLPYNHFRACFNIHHYPRRGQFWIMLHSLPACVCFGEVLWGMLSLFWEARLWWTWRCSSSVALS